jgi:hypothetical protein
MLLQLCEIGAAGGKLGNLVDPVLAQKKTDLNASLRKASAQSC